MDPSACLLRAVSLLNAGEIANAVWAFEDYRTWRNRGGVEPSVNGTPGDTYARQLEQILKTACASHGLVAQQRCRIEWIDTNGNTTPDNHVAVGTVRQLPHYCTMPSGRTFLCEGSAESFPICAEHALQRGAHWLLESFPKE